MKKLILLTSLFLGTLTGCASGGLFGERAGYLSDQALLAKSSAGPLEATRAKVITDNDEAFLSKLKLVEDARQSIDMIYYIYKDDYSSSALTQALIDAARRGVNVRLLVDYSTNYRRLDLFSMMEKAGNERQGSLHVRFYNRPTKNIVQDAVYVTLGCGTDLAGQRRPGQCALEKFAAIDKLFATETIDGKPVADRNISNLNIGNSGLFLSGLYSKRPDVMALAVSRGQDIDLEGIKQQRPAELAAEDREKLKRLARVYWDSRTAPAFQRLVAKGELFFAFLLYGEKLNPIWDTFTSLLPAEKPLSDQALLDWDHFTDFTHHKLLLADQSKLQMGGRNVEDSYHMKPNPLTKKKYTFMDTDVYAELNRGGDRVSETFDALWNFDAMVATLAEVRQHAPNDLVANLDAYRNAKTACRSVSVPTQRTCVDREFQKRFKDLAERVADSTRLMERNARIYRSRYAATLPPQGAPAFEVDSGALYAYLENLPFDKSLPPSERRRIYGAQAGKEASSGKHIHDVWLKSLPGVCQRASRERPQQIILHNAYFFPPANLSYALSQLVNGDYDCSNVTVTVLTNSIETTDLNIVNVLARHSLKAFTEFYQQHGNPTRRAKFDYYEYQPRPDEPKSSLHTKAALLGDDFMIGSANADVRSFMMDSNNALLVRGAPGLQSAYAAHIQQILNDPGRSKKLNDYLAATPREVMLQEDLATFRKELTRYGVDKRLNQQQRKTVETLFVEMLNQSYAFTKGSIGPDGQSAETTFGTPARPSSGQQEQQNLFNGLFKPI